MAYRFTLKDGSVQDGLRRIACDQIDKAAAELDDPALDVHGRVHQVRKRCKKLRGLIRLVRPVFKDYARENAAFRDAARELAPLRDARVRIATYDALMDAYRDEVDRAAFAPVRRRLTMALKDVMSQDADGRIARARAALADARDRAAVWTLKDDGFDALADGAAKTYGRARAALDVAADSRAAADLHELRKRIKYHRYHMRLLTPLWRGPFEARRDAADRLGDHLGDHHDLAVFAERLTHDDIDPPDALGGLIAARQKHLADAALPQAARLLAEPEDALVERWRAYWSLWRTDADALEPA